MDLKNGVISVGGVDLAQGFSFDEFKNTPLFSGQDGIRMICPDELVCIDGVNFKAGIMFRNGLLYLVSLYCVDLDTTPDREAEVKEFHDAFLRKYGLSEHNSFSWGSIESCFDPRSCSASICFTYNM